VIILFGRDLLGLVPVTVCAGIMVIVALGMFDQWSASMLRQLRADRGNHEAKLGLAVVIVVCLATIVFGFVVAIAVGVLLSFVLFIVAMNRSLVRSIGTGAMRSSRRIYFPDQAKLLREQGERIRIVELEGAVFFGTAEKLTLQVDQLANDARYIILDVKRVTTIDASGAMALERMARQLHGKRITLLLSGLVAGDRHARALLAFGTFLHREGRLWFSDADHALEHAERGVLDELGVVAADVELPLEALSLLEDLAADQRNALQAKLSRVSLASGEVLFHKGDPGDRLFVLAKGSISVLANSSDAATAQRLASFAPGVIFGETAMLDGGGRTATGVADQPSVVYVLTRDALDEIRRTDPTLATQVLLNLARQLSARMRFASATIQAADY
jgi:anti-anti-sigma regulatory factor